MHSAKLFKVLGFAVLLAPTDMHAQFLPVVAKRRLTKEHLVDGKVVDRVTKEGNYYRSSDGSILEQWTRVNGDEKLGELAAGSLWDNKNVVSYQLDFKNRIAYLHAPPQGTKPVRPDVSGARAAGALGEEFLEGISCRVFPVRIAPRDRPAFYAGQVCRSVKYDLELKQELSYPNSAGKIVHTVFQLYDIQLGREPDPKLFDVRGSFTVYAPESPRP